jgi:hypothetical protein
MSILYRSRGQVPTNDEQGVEESASPAVSFKRVL